MESKPQPRAKSIMLMATLAAVYTVLRVIPTFPLVGILGARFSASDFIASLYGVILGPYSSVICIMIGTVTGYFVGRPPIFYGLDFLPAALNGFVVGLLIQGRRRYALLTYLVLLVLFLWHPYALILIQVATPYSQRSILFPFVWLHVLGLIILGSPVGLRVKGLLSKKSIIHVTLGFSLTSLIGTLAQHLTGNLLYASVILPLLSESARVAGWTMVFWLYPVERLMIVVVSTIVGVPIIRALVFRLNLLRGG